MAFRIFKGFPPDRDSPVADFHEALDEGGINFPAQIYRQDGNLMITIFARTGEVAWEYPLDEFTDAIESARAILS